MTSSIRIRPLRSSRPPETGRSSGCIGSAHIPGIIDFCRFNQGIYSGIFRIWNLPPAQVEEARCFFKGDEYCEYHLKWEKRFSLRESWLRLLMPWSLLKSTIEELEQDKELLKYKFNEIHTLNLQLREKIDHLECLQQTSAAAMSLLFMEDMVQFCLGLLIKFTKLDRGVIFLLDDQGQTLSLQEAVGFDPERVAQIRDWRISLFDPKQLMARVALDGNLAVFPVGTPEEPGQADPVLDTLQFAAGLAAPLMVRHQIIGVLLAGVPPGAALTGSRPGVRDQLCQPDGHRPTEFPALWPVGNLGAPLPGAGGKRP